MFSSASFNNSVLLLNWMLMAIGIFIINFHYFSFPFPFPISLSSLLRVLFGLLPITLNIVNLLGFRISVSLFFPPFRAFCVFPVPFLVLLPIFVCQDCARVSANCQFSLRTLDTKISAFSHLVLKFNTQHIWFSSLTSTVSCTLLSILLYLLVSYFLSIFIALFLYPFL